MADLGAVLVVEIEIPVAEGSRCPRAGGVTLVRGHGLHLDTQGAESLGGREAQIRLNGGRLDTDAVAHPSLASSMGRCGTTQGCREKGS